MIFSYQHEQNALSSTVDQEPVKLQTTAGYLAMGAHGGSTNKGDSLKPWLVGSSSSCDLWSPENPRT